MRRMMIICAAAVLSAASAVAAPRIAPVPESAWTAEQRELAGMFPGSAGGNDFRTLLVHPASVRGVMPFATYVQNETTITPRHRELLILRTAWLCRSDYLWAKHAARAAAAGLSAAEIARIAQGPDAAGWDPFEATLLRSADELHHNSFVSTPTWQALAARYGTEQLMDAMFAVTEFTMLAMTYNSVGVEKEAGLTATLPTGGARATGARSHQPLTVARVEPLPEARTTPAIKAMLDPAGTGRPIAAIYRTFAQHERLYPPRQRLSEYIRRDATLTPRIRELLILRIGYLCGSDYEWSAHAGGGRRAGMTEAEIKRLATPGYEGWSAEDAVLVRAVDELYASDKISDATWKALDARFDDRELIDVLITTGGYRMVSMALNTLGVQLEANGERIPR